MRGIFHKTISFFARSAVVLIRFLRCRADEITSELKYLNALAVYTVRSDGSLIVILDIFGAITHLLVSSLWEYIVDTVVIGFSCGSN